MCMLFYVQMKPSIATKNALTQPNGSVNRTPIKELSVNDWDLGTFYDLSVVTSSAKPGNQCSLSNRTRVVMAYGDV